VRGRISEEPKTHCSKEKKGKGDRLINQRLVTSSQKTPESKGEGALKGRQQEKTREKGAGSFTLGTKVSQGEERSRNGTQRDNQGESGHLENS